MENLWNISNITFIQANAHNECDCEKKRLKFIWLYLIQCIDKAQSIYCITKTEPVSVILNIVMVTNK